MAIDPKLPIPVYLQLKTLLLEEILEGSYGLEGRLPTEHELCASPDQPHAGDPGAVGAGCRGCGHPPPAGTFVNPHWVRGGGPAVRTASPLG